MEALLKCTGHVCLEQLSRGLSSFCKKRFQEVVDFYSFLSSLSSEVESVFELCDTVIYLLRDMYMYFSCASICSDFFLSKTQRTVEDLVPL